MQEIRFEPMMLTSTGLEPHSSAFVHSATLAHAPTRNRTETLTNRAVLKTAGFSNSRMDAI